MPQLHQRFLFDTWTPMSFKRAIGGRKQPGIRYEEPTWVGEHARRLAAYKVLRAYIDNAAREFLALEPGDEARQDHREYGDAALLVETILTALLGDSQKVVVPEAADYSPPRPGDSKDPSGEDPPGAVGSDNTELKAAWDFQQWMQQLWRDERGPLKVLETERDAVGLGDGVYSLGWSSSKKRVRIRCWDPGFYFPVLEDGNDDDYPDKVHIAYEFQKKDDNNEVWVRRLTWELVEADEPYGVEYEDDPVATSCLFSDASWKLDHANKSIEDFDPSKAVYAIDDDGQPVNQIDLGIDFIPVVHIPNTVAVKECYGRSSISSVLQILDDLANTDTDGQAASATAAKPVMALKGGTMGRIAPAYHPGEVWEVGDGDLNLIDTSKALDAVIKFVAVLLERMAVNARTPDALLGRIKPSEVPSGVAMAMSFGPLAAMIGKMRMSRNEKYPILFKFIWRMSKAAGADGVPPDYFDTELRLGSYLPIDKDAAVNQIAKLLSTRDQAPAISLQTAIQMLIAQGFPIEDAVEEVKRIQSQDFIGADNLRTATGSADTVFKYLHMEKPADAVPVVLPGSQPPGTPEPNQNNNVPPTPGPPKATSYPTGGKL